MSSARHVIEAQFLREATGTTALTRTLRKVVALLAREGIPHLVCGGLAVQENGYPRMTVDVDLIVPDVGVTRDYLSLHGFAEIAGNRMTVKDCETRVDVDLLPGGRSDGPTLVSFPMPTEISAEPQWLSLEALISNKLGIYYAAPRGQTRHLADVEELIKRVKPVRDLPVDPAVKDHYLKLWDGLQPTTS